MVKKRAQTIHIPAGSSETDVNLISLIPYSQPQGVEIIIIYANVNSAGRFNTIGVYVRTKNENASPGYENRLTPLVETQNIPSVTITTSDTELDKIHIKINVQTQNRSDFEVVEFF